MTLPHSEPGFYGKLPILGDFVTRRLPRDFLNPWDSWLQSSIAASKEELGDAWLNSYLSSPIWRFALSPGVCGYSAWAGILMPSVDKVGRYFPLTVAASIDSGNCLAYLMSSAEQWFEHLEEAALSGLEDGLDPEVFDRLIKNIPAAPLGASEVSSNVRDMRRNAGKKAFYLSMARPESIGDAFVGLSASLMNRFVPGFTLWSTGGSEDQTPSLLACEGLPPIAAFSGFLNGLITERGWDIEKGTVPENLDKLHHSANTPETFIEKTQNIENEHDTLPFYMTTETLPDQREVRWQSWALTDTGKRRKFNEDSILDRPEAGLWAVADGMGGHQAGDVASQLIVDRLNKVSPRSDLEAYCKDVSACIVNVNKELRELSSNSYNDSIVGSTVLVLIGNSNRCAFLWAGDSRLYRLRDNKLEQLTRDHCAENEIAPEQSVSSAGWTVKQSNVITRAVGADDELELDCGYSDVRLGDLFLLSSDGLDKELSFNEIESILLNQSLKTSAKALLDLALDRGARDNVSVIVVSTNGNSVEK